MRTVAETPIFVKYAAEVWSDVERQHTVWLLIVYKKAKFDNLPAELLAKLKKGIDDAF